LRRFYGYTISIIYLLNDNSNLNIRRTLYKARNYVSGT
jgi:hypothetical protein